VYSQSPCADSLPPPWTIEPLDAGYKVVDANKQTLAYVYGHADQRDAAIAKSLTLDEARRIASNIAKLPSLLLRRVEKAADLGVLTCSTLANS